MTNKREDFQVGDPVYFYHYLFECYYFGVIGSIDAFKSMCSVFGIKQAEGESLSDLPVVHVGMQNAFRTLDEAKKHQMIKRLKKNMTNKREDFQVGDAVYFYHHLFKRYYFGVIGSIDSFQRLYSVFGIKQAEGESLSDLPVVHVAMQHAFRTLDEAKKQRMIKRLKNPLRVLKAKWDE